MDATPSCALPPEGRREQGQRYARLAEDVAAISRDALALHVEFVPGFDRETLEEAVAIERRCCPFFELDFDEARRRLTIAVAESDHLPALAGLAEAMSGRNLPGHGPHRGSARGLG